MPLAGLYQVVTRIIDATGASIPLVTANPNRILFQVWGHGGFGVWGISPLPETTPLRMLSLNSGIVYEWTYERHGDLALVEWFAIGDVGMTATVVEVIETAGACRMTRVGD